MKTKKKLEIFTKDEDCYKILKENEGNNVNMEIEVEQNKFGTRLGDIVNVEVAA